ncbi:hypothetical protein [Actinomadura fibrosa]|uniref:DUF4185 domain-containing protein n=1 Tax=Actinomadura fibrosa TaxID=111802 RepID=A0ABW2XXF3_9ACTN|nr:hypothetical protein [Actinomadura fibrosa]
MIRRPVRPAVVAAAAVPVALALLVAVAVTVGLGSSGAPPSGAVPPARVLSRYETAARGNTIDRDCGYSTPLPGRPRRSLWLFCDSAWKGTRPGLWLGATAATAPIVPGRVPTALTELPAPGAPGRPPSAPAREDGPPQGMLSPPSGLVLPGGAPCQVPGTAYSASWVSGAARPPGTDEVLLTFTDVCVQGTTISTQGFGLVTYRPADNTLHGRIRLFSAPAGLPFQQNLGSPVFRNGHLYLFGSVCDTSAFGGCRGGRVTLARVRASADAWRDPGAYEYWTPGGWTRDAGQARTVVYGAAPTGVHIEDFSALGKGLVLVEQRGLAAEFRVWRAPAPEGPWHAVRDGKLPCAGGSGIDQCRALIGHPELSTREALLLSYYNPADRHISVRAVPW